MSGRFDHPLSLAMDDMVNEFELQCEVLRLADERSYIAPSKLHALEWRHVRARHIRRVLAAARDMKTAAMLLGCTRTSLKNWLESSPEAP